MAKAVAPPLSNLKLKTFLQQENPIKFVILRHPLDRLLSAYRDKFESMNDYFHKKYGNFMVSKYRIKGINRFGQEFYDKNKNFNGCPLGDENCSKRRGNGSTPTFWEFIQALIYDGISDPHWRPIHLCCR